MTTSDVIWIAIPVAIAVVLVLLAIVTQARTPHRKEAGPGDPTDDNV